MTLEEMYKEIPDFRKRFRKALDECMKDNIFLVVQDIARMTSSKIEEDFIVENLKEVYEEWLKENISAMAGLRKKA